jgi:hypothetical protein
MEILSGNEVNPGYRTKKLMLRFPMASLTKEIKKIKIETLYNKENQVYIKNLLI